MFPGTEAVSGVPGNLQVGNLLGWMQGQSPKYPNAGHVVMYIGGGQFIEVHGGSGTNGAVSIRNINHYGSSYRHIMRTP